jgi:hypothetical protein
MNPGATMRPVASIVRAAVMPAPFASPTNTMRSARSATSARRPGVPEPSYSVPLVMSTSAAVACAAAARAEIARMSASASRLMGR